MGEARRLSVGTFAAWAVIAASYVVHLGTASWAGFDNRFPSGMRGLLEYPAYAVGVFAVAAVVFWRRFARRTDFGLEPSRARPDLYLQSFAIFTGLSHLGARSAEVWTNASWLGTVARYGAPFVALAWPLARGVRWRDLASDLGLCRGRGLRRELLVGVVAGVLLYAVECAVHLATLALTSEDAPLSAAPRTDGKTLLAAAVASLLLWAPVVEETMYRGALFRGVRGSSRWFVSGVVTAVLFALAHTPSWGWPSHFVFGLGVAFVREWRRSLVAPMVMHALSNSVPAYFFVRVLLS